MTTPLSGLPVAAPPHHPPAATGADSRGRRIRRAGAELADRRFRWFHQLAFAASIILFLITMLRMDHVDWDQRFAQAGYQIFIVAWFMAISYPVRTIGFREIVRFWLMGFFTVVFLTYLITKPAREVLGPGNLQSGVLVPLVEELLKVLPVVAWGTLMRGKFRHGMLSDFWLLGLVTGAGFSFHEDSLYSRLASSGFSDELRDMLFPTTLNTGSQFAIVHSGWAAIAAVGVGIVLIYRHHWWGWTGGAVLFAVSVLDHGAVNWGGSDLFLTLTGGGHVAAWVLLLSAPLAVVHDAAVLRWAGRRDSSFPPPRLRDEISAVQVFGVDKKVAGLLWLQRYRRLRNSVFMDLCKTRLRGAAPGDRRDVVRQLATTALHAGKPVDRRLARSPR